MRILVCRAICALRKEKAAAAEDAAASAGALAASHELNASLETAIDKLQRELHEARATIKTLKEQEVQHKEALVPELEAARRDAATAASQLVEACEENARLSEALTALEVHVGRFDAQRDAWHQKEREAVEAIASLKAENARLRAAVSTSGRSPGLQPPALSYSTPRRESVLSAAQEFAGSDADPDDILAVEVSRLRHHTEELEAQLAAAGDAAPIVAVLERETAALRAENALLRDSAQKSSRDASQAQRDLMRVQQEAQTLHAQLSDVISSLSGAGLAGPGPAPLQLAEARAPDSTVRSGRSSEISVSSSRPTPAKPKEASPTDDSPSGIVPSQHWRGPPTPTSELHYASTSARRHTAESDSGSDMILAELRSAMAALEPLPVDHGCGSGEPVTELGGNGVEAEGREDQRSAAEILESISRGIALLGRAAQGSGAECSVSASAGRSGESSRLQTPSDGDVFGDI